MLCITSLGQGSLTLQALWKEKFEQVPGLEKAKLRLSSYGFEIDCVISSHSVTCFFPQIVKLLATSWPEVAKFDSQIDNNFQTSYLLNLLQLSISSRRLKIGGRGLPVLLREENGSH